MTYSVFNFENPEKLVLDCGETLPKIEVAYNTYGELNHDQSNVILICHPLTGDSEALNWWPKIVGPGLAIDTNHYFVVCSNALGGCNGTTGPASINPKTGQPYGLDFPVITISDMVKVQRALIASLGINKIKMVIGGSMGGMMALEWVSQAPDQIDSCVPIASTTKVSPLVIAFDAVGRNTILEQLKLDQGSSGLALARQLGHITYLSEDALEKKFSRKLQVSEKYTYSMSPEFQVESYLNYQGKKFVDRFNYFSYLYLTKAVSYFDLNQAYGSVEQALSQSSAKFLVLAIRSDWLYTASQSKALAYELMKLNKHVAYVEIDSDYGHDTFLIDSEETRDAIKSFLESL
ncbi:MAG: homoserine O-acetyltransferase [Candidatus Margulisiibacteriota bacterium]